MAQPTNPEVRFRVMQLPNGTQIINFPDVTPFLLHAPDSTEDAAQEDPVLRELAEDERWLEEQRTKMEDCENELMFRLIRVYHGLWPDDCREYLLYDYVSKLFKRLEKILKKRGKFGRYLNRIVGKPEYAHVYDKLFAELKKLHYSFTDPLHAYLCTFTLLENSILNPALIQQHPDAAAFISDLDRISDKFRDTAWDERTKKMEIEERLEKLRMNMM